MNQTGLRRLSEQTVNLTHFSHAFPSQRCLGVGLCGESMNQTGLRRFSLTFATLRSCTLILCGQHHRHTLKFAMFLDIFRDMISIVYIVCVLMTCLSRLYRKSINHPRTTLGSCIWSRRRIFWRNAGISRESYIAHALKSRYYDNFKFSGMQEKVVLLF